MRMFVNLNANLDWKNKMIIDRNLVCVESTSESGDLAGDVYLHSDPIWMQKFSYSSCSLH